MNDLFFYFEKQLQCYRGSLDVLLQSFFVFFISNACEKSKDKYTYPTDLALLPFSAPRSWYKWAYQNVLTLLPIAIGTGFDQSRRNTKLSDLCVVLTLFASKTAAKVCVFAKNGKNLG
ncbi:hypothetical protein [Pedobacter sp. SL55]|uniref:hypothetical protein n=1 Tax=Pedobacter sp. SL55 TaxID=2995161 RepID=UPI00226FFFAD|nr:hypothetical protein [Pedobacter sp. SL55]WAC41362.1 hypothetical protein OVA16_03075 [Pedobacter sp. SL55]